ncbi:hypothetical protein [Sporosarcina sp. Te-1]|uniref:hypothetical protein n=1 Tax=Sporosarcina sp. Te-1 TaxID=2818390 RepID=UPI001A9EA3AD|nr:hypothetical protein [Sporosarcina sp. Te-1]QTD39941.1 hypothetical protein J3U78_14025 [Sporosarcina sp. Te-1]
MDSLSLLVSAVLVLIIVYKNKDIWKKLTSFQRVWIVLSFLGVVAVAYVAIYYGGNWLAGQISNTFLGFLVFVLIVFLTLSVGKAIWTGLLRTITKGLLPQKK